jgi:probable rRNA maturation factor
MTRSASQGRRRAAKPAPQIAVIVKASAWERLPRAAALARRAAGAALAAAAPRQGAAELSIVLADNRAVRRLNRDWRGKDKPTNVLSFPADGGPRPAAAPRLLGDVIIALGVTAAEADEQGKTLAAHFTHLVVHGVLHLVGHDHERESEAARMEALEIRILRGLGIADPYRAPARSAA